ncbi:hypothetical protein LTR37_017082 [Vermiconidia calcicola]|uniref:Uncharacterized protein n=1 Tax=Vermiconidia calcicola TaxID=1690605 RepID=A0ACC3MLQ2_9PEZI|nr:hypothetical protein LTR37_017082 [Vermiconidia calcicola]
MPPKRKLLPEFFAPAKRATKAARAGFEDEEASVFKAVEEPDALEGRAGVGALYGEVEEIDEQVEDEILGDGDSDEGQGAYQKRDEDTDRDQGGPAVDALDDVEDDRQSAEAAASRRRVKNKKQGTAQDKKGEKRKRNPPLIPLAGTRTFYATTESRGTVKAGDKLTPAQHSAYSPRWNDQDDAKLLRGVAAEISMANISRDLLPHRGYASCKARFDRLYGSHFPGTPRRAVGEKIINLKTKARQAKEMMEKVGLDSDDEQQLTEDAVAKTGPLRQEDHVDQQEQRPETNEVPSATETEARMFSELPAGNRRGSGRIYETFQYHKLEVPDFSQLAATLKDLRSAHLLRPIFQARSTKSGVYVMDASVILACGLNDYASTVPGASGHMVYDLGYSPEGVAYFANLPWDDDMQQEYRSVVPYSRFNLNSAVSHWHILDPKTTVLPVLFECAKVEDAGTDTYVAKIEVLVDYWRSAKKSRNNGPLLIISLPGEVIVTNLQDMAACQKTWATGGPCEIKNRRTGFTSLDWTFVPSSAAYQSWAQTRSLAMDASLQLNMLGKLKEVHVSAAQGHEKGVGLQKWSEVLIKLLPGS